MKNIKKLILVALNCIIFLTLNSQSKTLYIEDKSFQAGDTFNINVWSDEITNIESYFYQLEFQNCEILSVEYKNPKFGNSYNINENKVSSSYNVSGGSGQSVVQNEKWATYKIKSNVSGSIDQICTIVDGSNSLITASQNVFNIVLQFSNYVPSCVFQGINNSIDLDINGSALITLDFITNGTLDEECKSDYQLIILENGINKYYNDSIPVDCTNYGKNLIFINTNLPEFPILIEVLVNDPLKSCIDLGKYPLYINTQLNSPYVEKIFLNGNILESISPSLFEIPETDVLAGENVITFEGKETLLNGISTLDLVLMQQNLLDIVDRGPLEALIGDVDRSGYLGLNDIIQNRKSILGISQGNNEYIFLKSDYIFPADFDKFDFGTDIYDYHFDGSDAANIDFTYDAYISGDVNLSGNIKGKDESDSREIATLSFIDLDLEEGQSYEVDFQVEQTDLAGLQFALHYENMNEIELIHNYNGIELMSHILNNELKISFLPEETQEDFSFKLRFKSLANGLLSDLISLNEEALKDELVTNAFEIKEIVLSPASVLNTVNIEALSLKAYPNPSNGNANIVLPENGSYLVNIFDVQGKLISKYTFEGKILTLNELQFTNTGIYTISMINSNNVYQARIIVQ